MSIDEAVALVDAEVAELRAALDRLMDAEPDLLDALHAEIASELHGYESRRKRLSYLKARVGEAREAKS